MEAEEEIALDIVCEGDSRREMGYLCQLRWQCNAFILRVVFVVCMCINSAVGLLPGGGEDE